MCWHSAPRCGTLVSLISALEKAHPAVAYDAQQEYGEGTGGNSEFQIAMLSGFFFPFH